MSTTSGLFYLLTESIVCFNHSTGSEVEDRTQERGGLVVLVGLSEDHRSWSGLRLVIILYDVSL